MNIKEMPMRNLLVYNAIRTPDGTVLESTHKHDCKVYLDTVSNEEYMVDGGNNYTRRYVNVVPYEELSLCISDDHDKVREYFTWGSRGKNADQPLTKIKLKDLTEDHIEAILRTQSHISGTAIEQLFRNELSYRKGKLNV